MPVTKNKEAETQVPTPAEEKKQPQARECAPVTVSLSVFQSVIVHWLYAVMQCLGPSPKPLKPPQASPRGEEC